MKKLILVLSMSLIFALALAFSVSAAYDNQVDNGEGKITAVGDCIIEGVGTFAPTRGLTYTMYDIEGYAVVKNTHIVTVETLYIPSTVTFDGVEYPVTKTIGGGNGNNTTLKAVYVPDSVIEVGNYSFASVKSLERA